MLNKKKLAQQNDDDQVRVYIADLAAYNAGRLRGEWIDLPADEDELADLVDRMSHGGTQDWAIHDYEAPFKISEYDDVFKLNENLQEVEDQGLNLTIVSCIKDYGGYPNLEDAIQAAEDAHVIDISDRDGRLPGNPKEALGYYIVDEIYGGVENLPENLLNFHFDYEKFGRDWSMDLDEPQDVEYYKSFSSDKEYGEAIIDDFGSIADAVGDRASWYFDYESFGRDAEMDYFLCGTYYIQLT